MSDRPEILSTATIANPRLWRLGMLLDADAAMLDVVAVSTVEDEPMLCRRIALQQSQEPLRALEEAVYDNPLLLADFDAVTLLLRTPHFSVLPASLAAEEDALEAAAGLLWPQPEHPRRLVTSPVKGTDAAVVTAMPADVAAFIGRTFPDARVMHALVPETAYFAAKARHGAPARVCAAAGPDGVDLMAFSAEGALLGATSYGCTAAADMAYYAGALAQVCGIVSGELQFFVAGNPGARDAMAGALREFAPNVAPWVIPAGMPAEGAGDDTPFPLIILPLCE
ncbi:MAG: DUF3822 family protein [Muribaculaceae bacterium]|nr:DUF3822 family protein [Muribaculaceae bacterium]